MAEETNSISTDSIEVAFDFQCNVGRGREIFVRWTPPAKGTFKINVDGASKARNNLSVAASVIKYCRHSMEIGCMLSSTLENLGCIRGPSFGLGVWI